MKAVLMNIAQKVSKARQVTGELLLWMLLLTHIERFSVSVTQDFLLLTVVTILGPFWYDYAGKKIYFFYLVQVN